MLDNTINIRNVEIDLNSIGIPFQLNKQQLDALEHLASFLNDEDSISTVLSGSAGTGKSSIVKILIEYVTKALGRSYDVILAAPTHKAKVVLNRLSSSNDTQTLHKILGLKPDVSIVDFDAKDLQFYSNLTLDFLPSIKTIYIIDECSMINDFMYDLIIDQLGDKGSKIIFIGDNKQLSPVKQSLRSKTFISNDYKGVELRQVMRQVEGNPLLEILTDLRKKPVEIFKPAITSAAGLYCHTNTVDFAKALKESYSGQDFSRDPFKQKILTFTNARAEALNMFVRRVLGKSKFLEVGDLLMGIDNYAPNSNGVILIYNGSEYVVKSLQKVAKEIPFFGTVPGYDVDLYDTVDDTIFRVFILDPYINPKILYNLGYTIENTRLDAINPKAAKFAKKKAWERWFIMQKSFVSFVDLIHMGRVIKKAGFSYGYALTTHKSQGSTYEDVFVDMKDINMCPNQELRRELQYVALSRAKKNVHLLI